MTKAAAPVKMQAARLDSADFTSPTTDSAAQRLANHVNGGTV